MLRAYLLLALATVLTFAGGALGAFTGDWWLMVLGTFPGIFGITVLLFHYGK